ncbi:hypothetical protein L6255_02060 [Candidatus Parcubacteria bacterium]|nr:hypothetical protein [Patescibacteria group bacterium]MBU4381077.1 hypothetical protein [Patescibacteria group bacterium]MCG2689200.1 hypothetical protein [Candidatus Parcubacteria bacterium]
MFIKSDFFQYSLLVILLALGAVFYFFVFNDPFNRFICVVATTAFYFIWGILHHATYERLSLKIFIEYLLIGSLVILFFAFSLKLR